MTAKIAIDSGSGGPVVGSRVFASTFSGHVFTFSNHDNTGVAGWKWEWLDVPPPSGTLNPLPSPSFGSTLSVTPDVVGGSILIRLTTYKDAARTIVDDMNQVVLGIRYATPNDFLIPPAGETTELDAARGWSKEVYRLMDAAATGSGGGGGAVTSVFTRTGAVTAQSGDYTNAQVGLGSVTNDAQLKRAAGDIDSFTLKATPVGADELLIEDSAAGFAKKKVTITSVVAIAPVVSVFGRTGAVTAQTGDYTNAQVGLGNVTNDAQLKRAAGDIDSFTLKASPVGADELLIEDSAASFAKKKVTITSVVALASGGVSSVFTRTGAVVATLGDYTSSQVTNSSAVAGSTVTDALNTLNSAVGGSLNAINFATRWGVP